MNYKFHHVHIVCKDLNGMISFFTDTLDARLMELRKFDGAEGAKIDFKGTQINLRVPLENEKVNGHRNTLGINHLAFEVDDCDEVYEHLKAEGFEFTKSPKTSGKIRTAFFKGPEDVEIELIQLGVAAKKG